MSSLSVREIKKILLESDNVASEVLPQLLVEDRFSDITDDEVREILHWCGDDEYVSDKEIILAYEALMYEKEMRS